MEHSAAASSWSPARRYTRSHRGQIPGPRIPCEHTYTAAARRTGWALHPHPRRSSAIWFVTPAISHNSLPTYLPPVRGSTHPGGCLEQRRASGLQRNLEADLGMPGGDKSMRNLCPTSQLGGGGGATMQFKHLTVSAHHGSVYQLPSGDEPIQKACVPASRVVASDVSSLLVAVSPANRS